MARRDFVTEVLSFPRKGTERALVLLPEARYRELLGQRPARRKAGAARGASQRPEVVGESAPQETEERPGARRPRAEVPPVGSEQAAAPAARGFEHNTASEPQVQARKPPPEPSSWAASRRITVQLGTSDGREAHPYLWEPSAEVNPFLLVVGGSGSGKTGALRILAEDLAAAGVAVVLLDVHGDLAVPGFESQRLGPGLGLNPLALPQGESPQRHSTEVVAYLERLVPTLGTRQAYRLRRVLDQAYEAQGLTASPSTWSRKAPSFADVVEQLEAAQRDPAQRAERSSLSGLVASLDRVFGDPVYSAAKQIPPGRLVSGRLRLDLTGLSDTAQKLVSDAVLRQIFGALRAAGPLPSGRGLRVFVLCDEAARVASSPSVSQIFREARKFGFGLAMASQLADDFDEELRGNAGTLLVLRANSAREIAKNARELDVPEAQLRALQRPGQGLIRTSAGTERLQLRAPGSPRAAGT